MHVDDLAHAVSVVFCRSALSDFDLTPGSMHVEEDEQVGRSIALILAVETFELAWSGRDRLAHLADELCPSRRPSASDSQWRRCGLRSSPVRVTAAQKRPSVGSRLSVCPNPSTRWLITSRLAGRAPQAATLLPHRRVQPAIPAVRW